MYNHAPSLTHVLPCMQVFDLQHFRPGPVLKQIWANFDEAIRSGDTQAELIRRWVQIAPPINSLHHELVVQATAQI